MSASRWAEIAEEVIRATLAELPADATEETKRVMLNARYPFGMRAHHPYRVWCRCVRRALGLPVSTWRRRKGEMRRVNLFQCANPKCRELTRTAQPIDACPTCGWRDVRSVETKADGVHCGYCGYAPGNVAHGGCLWCASARLGWERKKEQERAK